LLAQAKTHGVRSCALEASSIGIVESRLQGAQVHTAVLTNFTHDHLDFHGNMDAYWRAKEQLFLRPELRSTVVNVDDPVGRRLVDEQGSRWASLGVEVWTTSLRGAGRLNASEIGSDGTGQKFCLTEGTEQHVIQVPFIGEFNVTNLLGVVGAMRSLGLSLSDSARACCELPQVPGRMERHGGLTVPLVFVDYAHTPDALRKALLTIRDVARRHRGRTICVFGCGGGRDAGKRPEMGRVASEWADQVVLTTDNPRDELPADIVNDILSGIVIRSRVELELDRAKAIHLAIHAASVNDMVLVAGKGHEDYQEAQGQRVRFLDSEIVDSALASWSRSAGRSTGVGP
jgi:UDP-N-acetylmuramoyl-L-alanyl-D-glutamate--2,6-diaminopimelate ligase